MSDINIHLHKTGKKTAELVCNWCKEPHAVEPAYREEILKRGKEELARTPIKDITPEETWTCGRCYLHLLGQSQDFMKTDCHVHEVPKKENMKNESCR